jgi:hypothetical protein
VSSLPQGRQQCFMTGRRLAIDRRVFITKIVVGALWASCPADAQRARDDYRIGYLSVTSATNGLRNLEALRAGLRTLGYIEGQNMTIAARWPMATSRTFPGWPPNWFVSPWTSSAPRAHRPP